MPTARRPGPPPPVQPGVPAPKFVNVSEDDPVVARYKQGLAERAKASGSTQRVPVPNMAVAMSEYRPERDGPMTLSAIAQAQENIRAMSESPKPVLRPETLAGLRALHEATAQQRENAPDPVAPTAPAPAPISSAEPPKEEQKKLKSITRDDEREALAESSDLDVDLMLERMRSDVINNAEERKAIEARLKPMDLADGLLTGEWRQHVPIQPNKLEVVFRTITPLENEEIRRHILGEILADERQARWSGERYGFMQTVAAVHSINGQELPRHLTLPDKGSAGRKFLWDVFAKKVDLFMAYPGPLIHALGTHAHWFDLRVRSLFSATALKNG
jgi:hypothetical protein